MLPCCFILVILLHATAFYTVSTFGEAYSRPDSGSKVPTKVELKLDSFARRGEQASRKVLLVDGNNLRGVSGLECDHVELQHRIEHYCKLQAIDLSIVVWDHGSCAFAIQTSNRSLVLFSGLSQRADDVLVKEVDFLLQQGSGVCLAVVTNDVGLTDRIRRTFDPFVNLAESPRVDQYLTVDSSGFVEILNSQQTILSKDEHRIQQSLGETKEAINIVRAKLRYGLGSRREKTWERVVLNEVLRRQLITVYGSNQADNTTLRYMQDLRARGYRMTPDGLTGSFEFHGPSRLDKRQRRTLLRFNKIMGQSITRL